MKVVRAGHGREFEAPETWKEAEKMIALALSANFDERGQNLARLSVCARVAYGLLCNQELTPDPTTALLFLLQKICQQEGAGLV